MRNGITTQPVKLVAQPCAPLSNLPRPCLLASPFPSRIPHPQPHQILIETLPRIEFFVTRSFQRRKHFLIETRMAVLPLKNHGSRSSGQHYRDHLFLQPAENKRESNFSLTVNSLATGLCCFPPRRRTKTVAQLNQRKGQRHVFDIFSQRSRIGLNSAAPLALRGDGEMTARKANEGGRESGYTLRRDEPGERDKTWAVRSAGAAGGGRDGRSVSCA